MEKKVMPFKEWYDTEIVPEIDHGCTYNLERLCTDYAKYYHEALQHQPSDVMEAINIKTEAFKYINDLRVSKEVFLSLNTAVLVDAFKAGYLLRGQSECIAFAEWIRINCSEDKFSLANYWCVLDNHSQLYTIKQLYTLFTTQKLNELNKESIS